ncbi:MAG: TrmH family RNA methyltransferase, partial [Planctomycetaceae bacterium]
MVERRRRGKGQRKLLAGHQQSWLWGRHLVLETLRQGNWGIDQLWIADDLPPGDLSSLTPLLNQLGLAPQVAPRARLTELAKTAEHQGLLARMGPFPYAEPATLLATVPLPTLWLLIDGVQDPFNLGSLLRSAGALGVAAVVLAGQGQVGVNSLVARASAGVIHRLPIARADDLAGLARELTTRGVQVVGAVARADLDLRDCDLTRPTAFVVGNE